MERDKRRSVRDGTLDEWRMAAGGGLAIMMTLAGALVGSCLAGVTHDAAAVFDLLEFWCVTTALSSLAHAVWSSTALTLAGVGREGSLMAMASAVMFSGIGSLVMLLTYLFVLDRVPAADLRNIVALAAATLPLQIGAVLRLTAQAKSMRQNPWDLDD